MARVNKGSQFHLPPTCLFSSRVYFTCLMPSRKKRHYPFQLLLGNWYCRSFCNNI